MPSVNELGPHYHGVRYRTTGYRQNLCTCYFRRPRPWEKRNGLATALEERLPVELGKPAEVSTHLESVEDHEHLHSTEHNAGRRDS
jgi:hypothetical protein